MQKAAFQILIAANFRNSRSKIQTSRLWWPDVWSCVVWKNSRGSDQTSGGNKETFGICKVLFCLNVCVFYYAQSREILHSISKICVQCLTFHCCDLCSILRFVSLRICKLRYEIYVNNYYDVVCRNQNL